VQQAGLGGGRRSHDLLKIVRGVFRDLLDGEPVACAGDEGGHVDDQATELLECHLESGQGFGVGPEVGREVLGEVVGVELVGRDSARQGGVDVECAVGVEGALERVYLAVLERLLAE